MNPDEELPEYDNIQKIKHEQWKAAGAALEDAEQEGQITPEERSSFHQSTIAPQLQRFDAMKQNTAKKQMDQQQQLEQHQHAHQTAMDHEATSFRARNVHDLIGTVTNPLTGKSRDLIENDKGDWTPIEYPEEDSGEEGDGGGVEGGGDNTIDNLSPTIGMVPGQTGTSPNSGGGQWRQTGMQKFNQATGQWEDYNPQQQQQQNQMPELLSHGEMQELWKRANDAIRLPPGHLRDQVVARSFDHLMGMHVRHKETQQARRDRAQSQAAAQAAKEKAAAAKEEEKKTKEMHTDYGKAYADARKEVQDEHKEWQKSGVESRKAEAIANKPGASDEEKAHAKKMRDDYVFGHPQYLMDDDAKRNEIAKRAQEQIRGTHGWTDEHFKKIGVDTGAKKPEAAKEQPAATKEGQRVAPGGFKPSEPTDKEMHGRYMDTMKRVSKAPETASHEDLNALHEMLAHPEKLGVDPEKAAEKRDGIATLLAGRNRPSRGGAERKDPMVAAVVGGLDTAAGTAANIKEHAKRTAERLKDLPGRIQELTSR